MHVVVVVFGRENVKIFESGVGIFSREKTGQNHLLHEFAKHFLLRSSPLRRPVPLPQYLCLMLCFLEYTHTIGEQDPFWSTDVSTHTPHRK